MLCLLSAQRDLGAGGGSGAPHHARCRREHRRVAPAGLEEPGRAGLDHFGARRCCLVHPCVLASQGSSSAGHWGRGWPGAGHGGDLAAVTVPVPRRPLALPALPCVKRTPSRSGDPGAAALRVPAAPSVGVPGSSGMPGVPRMQGPPVGADPAVVSAVGSVQRWGWGDGRRLAPTAPSVLWSDPTLKPRLRRVRLTRAWAYRCVLPRRVDFFEALCRPPALLLDHFTAGFPGSALSRTERPSTAQGLVLQGSLCASVLAQGSWGRWAVAELSPFLLAPRSCTAKMMVPKPCPCWGRYRSPMPTPGQTPVQVVVFAM